MKHTVWYWICVAVAQHICVLLCQFRESQYISGNEGSRPSFRNWRHGSSRGWDNEWCWRTDNERDDEAPQNQMVNTLTYCTHPAAELHHAHVFISPLSYFRYTFFQILWKSSMIWWWPEEQRTLFISKHPYQSQKSFLIWRRLSQT